MSGKDIDADQRITHDVEKLTTNLSSLVTGMVKPIVDILWLTWRMKLLTGRRGVAILYAYMLLGLGFLRSVAPEFGDLSSREQELEGIFRFMHSRLRTHAESIAFFGGGSREKAEFPPISKLDLKIYGDQRSSITAAHIEKNLEGHTVDQALKNDKLFILDHHDTLMPYVNRINSNTSSKIYATRTLLFLKDNDTLKPLAIELSLPNPNGEQLGVVSKVFTPADDGVQGSIWHLAKAYIAGSSLIKGSQQILLRGRLTNKMRKAPAMEMESAS